jgi:ABC-type multidrug transport system permease subunit
MAEAFMSLIAACVPHFIIGIALAAGFFGFFMLCQGFFIVKDDIPDYLIWGYYIAPHTYIFQLFM